MLGPRYDEQVAEENRFHPSMLSNYLKSLKVKLNFLIIETLLSLLMFTQVLLFRSKEKVVDGFVWDTCTEFFFVCLHFQVSAMNRLQVFSYRLEFLRLTSPAPSAVPHKRPFISLVALLCSPSSTSISFLK